MIEVGAGALHLRSNDFSRYVTNKVVTAKDKALFLNLMLDDYRQRVCRIPISFAEAIFRPQRMIATF
jgi:hypothetical protein